MNRIFLKNKIKFIILKFTHIVLNTISINSKIGEINGWTSKLGKKNFMNVWIRIVSPLFLMTEEE
jgi:hypothetical protein